MWWFPQMQGLKQISYHLVLPFQDSYLSMVNRMTMIKDGKQKIGVLAQEIKEVFPELVSEDDNEMLAVNYQGLSACTYQCVKRTR